MINWTSVEAADCAVPVGHPMDDLVRELSDALADPDPLVRDGAPYAVLATWIERGTIERSRRLELGDEMATRFTHPRTEARTFAPLVLDMLVTAGDFEPRWVDAFERWYPAERDLRGRDETLGWLHAVAHGADLLACFGLHPEVAPTRMLDLAAARLTAPTDHVWDQLEDDRLARAIGRVLTRTDMSERDAVDWLEPIADRFGADRISTPVPAHLGNCLRTLRLLYILADRGVRPTSELPAETLHHRDAVKSAVATVLDRIVRR
ncbi:MULTISPECIES: DUF2785 domain-containing protein [unclassified Streptomyces]|uniref:DUF2785 domain-containing protein n=1 Tax=unclassified Streptomyces TaxID=2593676 RepID=UPI001661252D|nr:MULTISPECIES: DUF2785 domain-containing protein [unclassified Streptomyces]MBD0708884.1 hypothetical protein [Streptomyces sp. CBMA291]MBD0715983.1 hypothetical protein [Streptomyces sp. CBMA370]